MIKLIIPIHAFLISISGLLNTKLGMDLLFIEPLKCYNNEVIFHGKFELRLVMYKIKHKILSHC